MNKRLDIRKVIDSRIYGENVVNAAECILEFIKSNTTESSKNFTYGILNEILGQRFKKEEIVITAFVLSKLNAPVLIKHYAFLTEESDIIEYNFEEEKYIEETGNAINPITGDVISGSSPSIVIYFSSNESSIIELYV